MLDFPYHRQYTEEELQKRYEEARLRHAARQAGTTLDTDKESQGTSNNENKGNQGIKHRKPAGHGQLVVQLFYRLGNVLN